MAGQHYRRSIRRSCPVLHPLKLEHRLHTALRQKAKLRFTILSPRRKLPANGPKQHRHFWAHGRDRSSMHRRLESEAVCRPHCLKICLLPIAA